MDGRLSGFAIMKFRDADAHLFLLAVEPRMQRTGIGAMLLAWLEKSCRTASMRHIRVEVRVGNRNARKFYERAGFRFVGQVAGYYDRHEPAVVMVKSLINARPG